jgi:hypothetical protein
MVGILRQDLTKATVDITNLKPVQKFPIFEPPPAR